MIAKKATTLFILLTAISLILFGILNLSLMDLGRLLAFSLGLSLVYILAYPYIFKVKKGDEVIVVANSLVPSFLGRKGIIISDVKGKNQRVVVRLDDGSEVIGILESYEELFSPPRVRLIYEEKVDGSI